MKIKTTVDKLNKEALTIEETAKLCKKSYRTISRWIEDGKLPSYQVKSDILVDRLEIPTFIRK